MLRRTIGGSVSGPVRIVALRTDRWRLGHLCEGTFTHLAGASFSPVPPPSHLDSVVDVQAQQESRETSVVKAFAAIRRPSVMVR